MRIMGKTPSTKHQAPGKLQTSSSNGGTARRWLFFGVWSLEFLWCLELGIWSFRSSERLHFHRKHRRQIAHDRLPIISRVRRAINLSAGGAEINAARIERIHCHRVAEYVHVTIFLRKAVRQLFPLVPAAPAAIAAQFAVEREMLRIALDRHHIDRVGLVGVNVDRETEIRRE